MSHVIVIGGASGIGAATVQRLTAAGVRVSVIDQAPATAEWIAAEPHGRWETVDVTDTDAYMAALRRIAADGVTGLVTCVGVSPKETLFESTAGNWQHVMNVNVVATALACQVVAQVMVDAGRGGSIVTVSSTAGFGYVNQLGAHYHASKGAIAALTRALASELGAEGIRVNSVVPGVTRTAQTEAIREQFSDDELSSPIPLRHIAQPQEVADVIAFLLSPDASMVTGLNLPADSGQLAVTGQPVGGFADIQTPVASRWNAPGSHERTHA